MLTEPSFPDIPRQFINTLLYRQDGKQKVLLLSPQAIQRLFCWGDPVVIADPVLALSF